MSFPRYDSYRDSGVVWLGGIPSSWNLKPFWTLFRRTKRTGFDNEQLLSVYRDYGVIPKASRSDNFNNPSEDLNQYQLVEPGDLAINKMKAWQGSVAISDYRGIVSPAYFIFKPTHRENRRFLHYLMRSAEYTFGYWTISKGIRPNQWDLEPQEHSRFPIILPSITEQTAIANFLDRETAKIDALINEQKKLIELLKEKRQAVISHAVTKGIDPNVPMKDSGVEWLGEVPAHWEHTDAGRYVSILSGYAFPSSEFSENDTGVRLLRGVNVGVGSMRWDETAYWEREESDGLDNFALKEGDLVIGMDRPWIGGGLRLATVEQADLPCLLLQRVAAIFTHERLLKDYLILLLMSDDFMHYCAPEMTGVSVPHISPSQIGGFPIPLPPLAEQGSIVEFVRMQNGLMSSLISEAEAGILLFQERRSALISAAVTGKIDVRDQARQQIAAE